MGRVFLQNVVRRPRGLNDATTENHRAAIYRFHAMLKREQFRGGNDHDGCMDATTGTLSCQFEIREY
jgi:hypothetical protein